MTEADATAAERRATPRRGFALPLAILVIAALTATLAAAFASVTAEIATNSAQRSESRAFALAESGLEEYIARRSYHCTARTGYTPVCGNIGSVDSEYNIRVSLIGGYADIMAKRVQKGIGLTRNAVYLIRSRGVDTVSPFNGGTRAVYGERIVAQYVQWNAKTIQVMSGWTSLTGLHKNGVSGTLGGSDHCSAASGGGAPDVAGVALPTGTMSGSGASVPTGNPPILNLGTQAQAAAAVKIDWLGLVAGTAATPDYTFASGASTPAGLVTAWGQPTNYPVVHITGAGNWSVPDGHGLLIIDGDATMSGNTTWDGIMLVGGSFTSNGTTNVYGAVMTGMNAKLTAAQLTTYGLTAPGSNDVGNGTKDVEYDSCEVQKASSRFGSFKVFPNAWMDNYTTY